MCNELDTTADTLLNGGVIINKRRKLIKVESIVEGFNYIKKVKECFGEDSDFYQGIVERISKKMNFDFEETLKINPQVLYTEVIINYILNGYIIDVEEAKQWITNEKYINEILKRIK